MSINEVFAISNKPGEVTLKGFNYIQDRFPDIGQSFGKRQDTQ